MNTHLTDRSHNSEVHIVLTTFQRISRSLELLNQTPWLIPDHQMGEEIGPTNSKAAIQGEIYEE